MRYVYEPLDDSIECFDDSVMAMAHQVFQLARQFEDVHGVFRMNCSLFSGHLVTALTDDENSVWSRYRVIVRTPWLSRVLHEEVDSFRVVRDAIQLAILKVEMSAAITHVRLFIEESEELTELRFTACGC